MTEQASADGPFTREDAVRALMEPSADVTPAAEPEAPEADEDISEVDPNPTEDASEAEEPGDGDEAEDETEAAAEPVDAPQWWDAEDKAVFAALTPEQQAVIRKQEDKREAIVAKTKQETAEKAKAYEAEVQAVRQFSENLSQFLPQAVETFKSKWEGVDWKATLEAYGAEETLKLKEDFAAEQAQLQQFYAAQQHAQTIAAKKAQEDDQERLKTLAPHLAEATKRDEVIKYAVEKYGIPPEAAKHATAFELTIAEKAMLWDRAQANLAAKPKTPPTPIKAQAKPGATPARTTPQQRDVKQIQNRFAQTASRDDAVRLILAKGL